MSAAARLAGVTLAQGGREVLSGVDLALPPGAFIGLLGPNGAGKTTLLRALLGLLPPASGTIEVLGAPARAGRADIGYLPQTRPGAIQAVTGEDLLAASIGGASWGLPRLAGRAASRAEIGWALAQTDAAGLARRPITALSGGERQRVLIAQALLFRPRLLLLDEPLAGLDPRHQAELVRLLADLRRRLGVTILMSAHELDVLLPELDQVLYLAGGRAALGPVDQVITAPVLSALYGAPMRVIRVDGAILVGAVPLSAAPHPAPGVPAATAEGGVLAAAAAATSGVLAPAA